MLFVLRWLSPPADVGVDVGGTFTDFVASRGRDIVALKLPTSRYPPGGGWGPSG
jgi:N-methylhydantoinase A/oxoprolinase/acetone carboxylase beta subunit